MKKWMITFGLSAFCVMGLYGGGDIEDPVLVQSASYEAPVAVEHVEIAKRPYTKWYAGGGVGIGKVNTYYYGKDSVTSLSANLGYRLYKNLDIEGRIYKGVKSGPSLEHSYSMGIFLKPHHEVDGVDLYALLGYGQTKITYVGSYTILNDTTTQNDWMYGFGLSYQLNSFWSVYGDMVRLIDKSTVLSSGPYAAKAIMSTIGFNYQF